MAPRIGARELVGHRLLDRDGHTVGKIGQVYLDERSGVPTWATVRTGLFRTSEHPVPMRGARTVDEDLVVPFDRETIRRAPTVEADRPISPQCESEFYRHYGLLPEVPAPRDSSEGVEVESSEVSSEVSSGVSAAAGARPTAPRADDESAGA